MRRIKKRQGRKKRQGEIMANAGGRPRAFASPEDLYLRFKEYKKWAEENPWIKKEAVKSGEMCGELIDIPQDRPLTEWEFAAFLGLSYRALTNYGSAEGYETFFPIFGKIQTEIAAQRISGGMVGAYNANLVARIDGLVEKQAHEHSGIPQPPSELRVIIDR
jgi:hypothetical protein